MRPRRVGPDESLPRGRAEETGFAICQSNTPWPAVALEKMVPGASRFKPVSRWVARPAVAPSVEPLGAFG